MKTTTVPITLNIFGKEYKIACGQDERDDLIASAQHLNQQMIEVRDSGNIIGTDRIAVMAALNIVHELKALQKQSQFSGHGIGEHLAQLRLKIESVLDHP